MVCFVTGPFPSSTGRTLETGWIHRNATGSCLVQHRRRVRRSERVISGLQLSDLWQSLRSKEGKQEEDVKDEMDEEKQHQNNPQQPQPYAVMEVISTETPSLVVRDLCKTFKRRFKHKRGKKSEVVEVQAVKNLSFTAHQGEIFGLLGPNSSGKTTAMKCIGTLSKANSGSIRVFGYDVLTQPNITRKMVGYVHQDAGVDKILTGREHLEMFGNLAHLDQATLQRNIQYLVSTLDMEEYIDLETGVYSGGIKRRLDIALALLHQPGLLLLDEPTTGLDLDSRNVIWNLLREYRDSGACILLTSHYLEEVETLADQVAIMDKGSLIAQGTPSELKSSLGGYRVQVRLEEFAPIERSEQALSILRDRGLGRDAVINSELGNALELIVTGTTSAVDVVEFLRVEGFANLFSFSQSKMSLGDVYLTATGRSLQDANLSAQAARDAKQAKKEQLN